MLLKFHTLLLLHLFIVRILLVLFALPDCLPLLQGLQVILVHLLRYDLVLIDQFLHVELDQCERRHLGHEAQILHAFVS